MDPCGNSSSPPPSTSGSSQAQHLQSSIPRPLYTQSTQTSFVTGFTPAQYFADPNQTSSPPGFTQTSLQHGFAQILPPPGFTQTSSLPGIIQSSPLPGHILTSPPPGFTQTSPPPDFPQTPYHHGRKDTQYTPRFAPLPVYPDFNPTSRFPGFFLPPPAAGFHLSPNERGFTWTPGIPRFAPHPAPAPSESFSTQSPHFCGSVETPYVSNFIPGPFVQAFMQAPGFISCAPPQAHDGSNPTKFSGCFLPTPAAAPFPPSYPASSELGSTRRPGTPRFAPPPVQAAVRSIPLKSAFIPRPCSSGSMETPYVSHSVQTPFQRDSTPTPSSHCFAAHPAQSDFGPASPQSCLYPPPSTSGSTSTLFGHGFVRTPGIPRLAPPSALTPPSALAPSPALSGFNEDPTSGSTSINHRSGPTRAPWTDGSTMTSVDHGSMRTPNTPSFTPSQVRYPLNQNQFTTGFQRNPQQSGFSETSLLPRFTPTSYDPNFRTSDYTPSIAPASVCYDFSRTSSGSEITPIPQHFGFTGKPNPSSTHNLSTPCSTQIPSASNSTKISGATGQGKEGFSFEQLYSIGKVYVFPPGFESKIKDKQWKEKLQEKAPIDPKQFPFDDASPSGRGQRLEKVEAVKKEGLEKVKSNMKGEEAECKVIIMIETLLREATKEDDLPVFVLHNLKACSSEKDIYIISRKVGVVIVEVKAADNVQGINLRKHLEKAVQQLKGARGSVRKELKGLLSPEGVRVAIALPNLPSDKEEDVRQLAGQNIQDVGVLMGQEASVYRKWLDVLAPGADSNVWDPSGQVGSPDLAFKAVAKKYLSVVRVREPDDAEGRVAEQHSTWLLTQDQMEVRDSTQDLLHVHGPPGAGKTLLLVHRARRWLHEGRHVLLICGSAQYDVLTSHLGRAVLRHQEEASSRLHVCSDSPDIKEAVKEWGGPNLCIVTDELHNDEVFTAMVEAVAAGRVQSCWSADVEDVTAKSKLSARARQLGWKAVRLEGSIRCPQHVVDWLNCLVAGSTQHSAIKACSVPRPRLLSSAITVIDHSVHQHCVLCPPDTHPWLRLDRELQCGQCRQELSEAMQSQHPVTVTDTVTDTVTVTVTEREKWRQWVVLHTGSDDVTALEATATALRQLHIPCVYEGLAMDPRTDVSVSTLVSRDLQSKARSLSPTSHSFRVTDEEWHAAWRERVVSGLDWDGRPAVHVVKTAHFRGLEKARVLLWHIDKEDFHPSQQSQAARTARLERHREQWFQAASRCQGQLVLLILSPSPARSLLQLPEPPVYFGPLPSPEQEKEWVLSWFREHLRK